MATTTRRLGICTGCQQPRYILPNLGAEGGDEADMDGIGEAKDFIVANHDCLGEPCQGSGQWPQAVLSPIQAALSDLIPPHAVYAITLQGPTRVLVNAEGEAVSAKRAIELGIKPDTIFLRGDGWTLGCIKNHEHVAAKMWEKDWKAVFVKFGTAEQTVIPFADFKPTRGDGKPVD